MSQNKTSPPDHRDLIPAAELSITPELEAMIKQAIEEATPGTFSAVDAPMEDGPEDQALGACALWFHRMLSPGFRSNRRSLSIVTIHPEDNPDKEAAARGLAIIALTNNGPNSANNARLFALSKPAISALLSDRSALLEEVQSLRSALDDFSLLFSALLQKYGITVTIKDGEPLFSEAEPNDQDDQDEQE